MPSRNHLAADPDGIRDGGRHFNGDLASTIGQTRSALRAAIDAKEQPNAYDDETGKAFLKVYGPAKKDMLTLLDSLEAAFRQAYDLIDGTAVKLAAAEDENTVSAQAMVRTVPGVR
jgi:hypothetical protein